MSPAVHTLNADPQEDRPLDLSVAIACKDNIDTLPAVLDSIAGLASEIIAVDSGSTDGTLDLLRTHHATIIESEWLGHVRTKQRALDACTKAWTLCLDSDEPVMPDLAQSIRATISADDPSVAGAMVRRVVWYAPGERGGAHGRFLNHAWQPEWRPRLARRGLARWTGLDPHDKLEIDTSSTDGPPKRVIKLDGVLRHDSFATFTDQLAKEATYAKLMAASLHADGSRGSVMKVMTSPIGAFLKQMVIKRAFLDGTPGILAAGSTAASTLMKHLSLLELTRTAENTTPGSSGPPPR